MLTSDSPKKAAAMPAWCSLEVTPGPGYYEAQSCSEAQERADKPAVAFGATGDGKQRARCGCMSFSCSLIRDCAAAENERAVATSMCSLYTR